MGGRGDADGGDGQPVTGFRRIGNVPGGEKTTTLQVTACEKFGRVIAKHARKAQPLALSAEVENNNSSCSDGAEFYGYNVIVISFDFGVTEKSNP